MISSVDYEFQVKRSQYILEERRAMKQAQLAYNKYYKKQAQCLFKEQYEKAVKNLAKDGITVEDIERKRLEREAEFEDERMMEADSGAY